MVETLVRVNIPSSSVYEYLPYGQGVYFAKLTKDSSGYGPYYSQWNSDSISVIEIIVGSVRIDQAPYDRKVSLVDCIADESSFFWDDGTQTLYIHFEFDKVPRTSSISIGIQAGYSFIGNEDSIYINDIEYQPRIISVPPIKEKADKFQTGKMDFQDFTIQLKNGDGELDAFIQNPIPGAEASIVLYDTDTDTELTYYTGFVTLDKSTYDQLSIKITDKRRRGNIKIPRTLFDATTYPDMESKYIGKVIPEGYGDLTRIECFPTNGDASSPTNISFKYATDATTLTSVEVKEDDVWTDVTASVLNSAPSTGSFDLPYATATNSSGAVLPCVATVRLRDYDNPGDIIQDMNDRYNSIAYDSTNYDTTEWASEKAKLADIALYMPKEKEFFKWIEDIQNGSDYWFIYKIAGDGRRTLRVNDPDRDIAKAISYNDIKDDEKPVERDFTEFSSTVAVLYDQDIESEVYQRIDVDTYEETVIETYLFPQDSEYESLLPAQADATRKANLIAEDQSEARPVVTVTMHEPDITALDLDLYDVVTVDTSRPAVTYWESVDDSITSLYSSADSITSDYTATDSITSTIGAQVVNQTGPPAREYWGTIRGQIIGIGYNPSNLSYTLTVRERPESGVV